MALRQNFFGKLALKSLSRLEEVPRHDQGSPPQFKSGIGGLSIVDANHIKIPSQPSLDTGLGAPLNLWSGPVDPGTVTGGWPLPSQHTTGTWMGLGKSKMENAPEKPVRCHPAAPRSAGLAPPLPPRPSSLPSPPAQQSSPSTCSALPALPLACGPGPDFTAQSSGLLSASLNRRAGLPQASSSKSLSQCWVWESAHLLGSPGI